MGAVVVVVWHVPVSAHAKEAKNVSKMHTKQVEIELDDDDD